MTIRLSAAHRDALYEQLLDRLSGIGDVWLKAGAEDFDSATKLGWEYTDDLRLILEDLGWGEGAGRSIELKTPPDVLQRIFSRLETVAVDQRQYEEPEWNEAREREERNRLVAEACRTVLEKLDR